MGIKNRKTFTTDSNRFSTVYPELLEEWDYEKNEELGLYPQNTKYKSNKKAWWICHKCNHNWKTAIGSRGGTLGSGCPKCNIGSYIKYGDNYISTKFPHLLEEWDYEKNSQLKTAMGVSVNPDTYKAFTNHKVWWICKKCGHNFQMKITHRTKGEAECPICKKQTIKNRKIICEDCGVNFDHTKEYRGVRRTKVVCKKCGEKKRLQKRTLRFQHPDIIPYIHPTKNININLDELLTTSNQEIWWICPHCKRESKEAVSYFIKRKICKKCFSKSASSIERKFFYFIEQVFGDDNVENTFKIKTKEKKRKIEIDIFIKSLNLGIEYDGVYFHSKKIKQDKEKNKILNKNGIDIIRIREIGLSKIEVFDIIYDYKNKKNGFKNALISVMWYIQQNYKLTVHQFEVLKKIANLDLEKYHLSKEYLVYPLKKNSLLKKRPLIAGEWNYEKNFPLTPDMVSLSSTRIVWWNCPKCKESYQRMVSYRINALNNCNCEKIPKLFLYKQNPELAKIWSNKNKRDIKTISLHSNRKVWWNCQTCGEDWLASPSRMQKRTMGYMCNTCLEKYRKEYARKKSIKVKFLDFKPELKKWFMFKKNNYNTEYGKLSKDLMWWKCPICETEFEKQIASMTHKKDEKLCPNYGTHKDYIKKIEEVKKTDLLKRYNIENNYPQALKYWDYELNDLSPLEVSRTTFTLIKWKCPDCNHKWQEIPKERLRKDFINTCPNCKPKNNSKKEKELYGTTLAKLKKKSLLIKHPIIAKDYCIEKNKPLGPEYVLGGTNRKKV